MDWFKTLLASSNKPTQKVPMMTFTASEMARMLDITKQEVYELGRTGRLQYNGHDVTMMGAEDRALFGLPAKALVITYDE